MTIDDESNAPVQVSEAVAETAAPEVKVCVNCGEPAVYSSPADNVMDAVDFCAKHKPINAPK